MNCIVYLTHYINETLKEYIDYIQQNIPTGMELCILYDINKGDDSYILSDNYKVHKFNSDEIDNFRMNNHVILVQPILPFIEFYKKTNYEHYLLMENDLILDGNMERFLSLINGENADYIHIANDFYIYHWPIDFIKNYDKPIHFSWCQLIYMSRNFINYVIDNYNDTMYYEFLLPSLAYNSNKFIIKQFENFGYNFNISAEWWIKDCMMERYKSNKYVNTFFHPIKNCTNFKKHKKSNDIKCAVVCPCKLENRYIKEFVEHYKKIGFKNVIIADNNNSESQERCSDVLNDYIRDGFVIIEDFIDSKNYQDCINYTYTKYKNEYDWIAYFETDEYLELTSTNNINDFVSSEIFDNFDIIELCWKNYGDNNLITVENNDYSLEKRFTKEVKSGTIEDEQCKCIIRCSPEINRIEGTHLDYIESHNVIRRCNADGNEITKIYNYGATVCPRTYNNAYIKHYRTKTLQEYIEHRIKRGVPYNNQVSKTHNINFFFLFNEKTDEKVEWLKNNYPYYYNQLLEPYNLEDYFNYDKNIDIYNY